MHSTNRCPFLVRKKKKTNSIEWFDLMWTSKPAYPPFHFRKVSPLIRQLEEVLRNRQNIKSISHHKEFRILFCFLFFFCVPIHCFLLLMELFSAVFLALELYFYFSGREGLPKNFFCVSAYLCFVHLSKKETPLKNPNTSQSRGE